MGRTRLVEPQMEKLLPGKLVKETLNGTGPDEPGPKLGIPEMVTGTVEVTVWLS